MDSMPESSPCWCAPESGSPRGSGSGGTPVSCDPFPLLLLLELLGGVLLLAALPKSSDLPSE